jgi:hypothetical protein
MIMEEKLFQAATGIILGILGWSLLRNIRNLDREIDKIEDRVGKLEATSGKRDVDCARRHPDDP